MQAERGCLGAKREVSSGKRSGRSEVKDRADKGHQGGKGKRQVTQMV